MGIKQEFYKLDLARQIQVTFIVYIIIFSALMVTITKLQLDWLERQMHNSSTSVIHDYALKKMTTLSNLDSKFLTNEFRTYFRFVRSWKDLTEVEIGQKDFQYLSDGQSRWTGSFNQGEVNYSTSAYGSIYGSPDSASQLIRNLSRLNQLMPGLYKDLYLNIYQGFEMAELLNTYPGLVYNYSTYTPLVKEWYYRAAENPGIVKAIDPIIDDITGKWVIAVSLSINNNTSVLGVAGIDVTLESISNKLKNSQILEGFEIIVTQSGMILNPPSYWKIGNTGRIFSDSVGFSSELWSEIVNGTYSGEIVYKDLNGSEFLVTFSSIEPYDNILNATHYNLVFVPTKKIYEPVDDIYNKFRNINYVLFWLVVSVLSTSMFAQFLTIYFTVKQTTSQLKLVDKVFKDIIKKALFARSARDMSLVRLDMKRSGIENLVDGCKKKITGFGSKEEKFSGFKWGLTRPNDSHLYSRWGNLVYPFNKMNGKKMAWRDSFSVLEANKNNK